MRPSRVHGRVIVGIEGLSIAVLEAMATDLARDLATALRAALSDPAAQRLRGKAARWR